MNARRTLVIIMALALGAVAGCSDATEATHGSTVTPSPSTPPTTSASSPSSTTTSISPAQRDLKSAEALIPTFWALTDKLGQNPKLRLDALAAVSRSPTLGVWQQLITKQRIDGVVQVGSSEVVSAEATRKSSGEFAVVACIDVSKVNVVDEDGRSVVSPNRVPRVAYAYVVIKDTGASPGFFVTHDEATRAC